ncbi:unnamed protein product [Arctia plantaginis]|uniref:Uncharacterized protein n=1 Tax=Arctia plantaginis TaxID=874455 RepID=A0A8S0YZ07_ARCPL|nr:unnamed protein product [Arctia plantaginis]
MKSEHFPFSYESNLLILERVTHNLLNAAAAAAAAAEALGGSGGGRRMPPPLLRSRTLPAIIAPGFSILHAQIDPQRTNGQRRLLDHASGFFSDTNGESPD